VPVSSPSTLLWYDLETTGTDPGRDRITQFAALRTSHDLAEIGAPESFFCAPSLDTLPHPEACLITAIVPQTLLQKGLCERDFMGKINALMSVPGTCVAGYNSIRFDDEFMRYGLYRNFLDPYAREWRNGNSRWDIIDLARMTHALRPQGIHWPEDDQGRPSFRLELLAKANNIEQTRAHDALSDVYATLGLARLIRNTQPRLYKFFYALRRKQNVKQQLDTGRMKPLLHVSGRYAATQQCITVIAPLAQHPVNKNGIIVYDLSADPGLLLDLEADQIHARVFTASDQLPDGIDRVPLKTIHLNRSPAIAPLSVLRPGDEPRLGIDLQSCMTNAQTLLQHQNVLRDKLKRVFTSRPAIDTSDPEEQLYDAFIPDSDRPILEQIATAQPDKLAALGNRLKDPRLPELLFRYRARNYPLSLDEDERNTWERWRLARLNDDPSGKRLTLDDYAETLAELRNNPDLDKQQLRIIEQLEAWGKFLSQPHPESAPLDSQRINP